MIIANKLVKTLCENEITLALAESITCGLAAHGLANYKGTGDVLRCSMVCYDEAMKTKLLGVPASMIRKFSAESPQVTARMADGLRRMKVADICAAVTGLASSGGSENKHKPVGTVFYAVSWKGKKYKMRKQFRGTPLFIRKRACEELYAFILKLVKQEL
jgi:PncC family amidohydrolase